MNALAQDNREQLNAVPVGSKSNRLPFIELARLLGLLAVIYLHLHQGRVVYHWLWSISLYGWMSFFFFISAYFAAKSFKFPSARIKGYLILYFAWNLIVFLMAFSRNALFSGETYSIQTFLARMLGVGAHPWDYPLWFLRDLIILSCLTPLFAWLSKRKLLYMGILAVLLVCMMLFGDMAHLSFHIGEGFLSTSSLFFFMLGYLLGRLDLSRFLQFATTKAWCLIPMYLLLVVAYGMGYTGTNEVWHILGIGGALLLCYGLVRVCSPSGRLALVCTPVFFFVYASHIIAIEILAAMSGRIPFYEYLIYLLPPAYIAFAVILYRFLASSCPRFCTVLFGQTGRMKTGLKS